jgi:hypothetical protein
MTDNAFTNAILSGTYAVTVGGGGGQGNRIKLS